MPSRTLAERGAERIRAFIESNHWMNTDSVVVVPIQQTPVLANRQHIANILGRYYPTRLRDAGISGKSVLGVLISPDGSPFQTVVLQKDVHAAFNDAAVRTMLEMRFKPEAHHGCRIHVWAEIPIIFQTSM